MQLICLQFPIGVLQLIFAGKHYPQVYHIQLFSDTIVIGEAFLPVLVIIATTVTPLFSACRNVCEGLKPAHIPTAEELEKVLLWFVCTVEC